MNEFIDQFHFLRPLWLLSILPALGLVYLLLQHQSRTSQWTSLVSEKLLPFLLDGEFTKAQKAPLYGLAILWVTAALSLAGPAWEKKPEPVQKNVSAMVILWDMSPSMFAQDIKPSRLVRSRLKLIDLLDKRSDGLTALIAYAGDAHVVTPLTDDTATIKSLLPGLTPSMMPVTGSRPEDAFDLAHELLTETGIPIGDIVFVTDGIASDAIIELASTAQQAQHRVTVWGIGTAEGAPIPLPSGGFVKNNRGEIVVAKVKEDTLSDAAIGMRGVYVPFSNTAQDIDTINYLSVMPDQLKQQESSRVFDQWLEHGHWLAFFMLPFAALAFRRGWILCLMITFLPSHDSYALSLTDLWKTKDQQATELLASENTQEAADTFKNQDWKAVANYRAGNYQQAQEHFQQGASAHDKYNYANTLTHLGEYAKAIEIYDEALTLNPDFTEAENNKKIAEQLKDMQEQEQEQEQEQQQNQEGESGENQESSDQQQDSSDQQNGEQSSGENAENQQSSSDEQQGESGESQASDNQQLDQAQKDALDEKYNDSEEENPGEQETANRQEEQEESGEQPEQEQSIAQAGEEEAEQQEQQGQTMVQMSEAEKEQQQALEQWLRRVPDDPSGLLRNKFRHEYEQRRREMQSRNMRAPNTIPEERW